MAWHYRPQRGGQVHSAASCCRVGRPLRDDRAGRRPQTGSGRCGPGAAVPDDAQGNDSRRIRVVGPDGAPGLVVVARALAQQCPLLLLDEPTSALDLGHQVSVLELVDDLRRTDGLSVLSAMHDLSAAARFADRLILIDRGRIVAQGSPVEVLNPDLLSEVYSTPLTVQSIDDELVVIPAPRRRSRSTKETP